MSALQGWASGAQWRMNAPSGTSPWIRLGTVVRLDFPSDTVVIGDTIPLGTEKLRVTGGASLDDGVVGVTPVSGAGTRRMWLPAKAAWRAGRAVGGEWDDALIADNSFAFGTNAEASSPVSGSLAMGFDVASRGFCSLIVGFNQVGDSDVAFMGGSNCSLTALSGASTVFGSNIDVDGIASSAFGANHDLTGNDQFAAGELHTLTGIASAALGFNNTVDGDVAMAFGERVTIAAGTDNSHGQGEDITVTASWALGRGRRALAQRQGGTTESNGIFANNGDAQRTRVTMRRATADAAATELTLDGTAPAGAAVAASNRLLLEDQHSYVICAYVVARSSGGGELAAYRVEGFANRNAGAASVTVAGVTTTTLFETTGTMDATLVADVVNGSVQLEVTGVAATPIRWVASVELTEVRFD